MPTQVLCESRIEHCDKMKQLTTNGFVTHTCDVKLQMVVFTHTIEATCSNASCNTKSDNTCIELCTDVIVKSERKYRRPAAKTSPAMGRNFGYETTIIFQSI